MAQAPSATDNPPSRDGPHPSVRLEVRARNGRPTVYDVGDTGFLIGTVPGCDLRLPGAESAPVVCLLAPQAGGVRLRKLAPVLPLAVNGTAVTAAALADGDRVSVGGVEIVVSISGPIPAAGRSGDPEQERADWERRRAEIEHECRRQQDAVAAAREELHRRERELTDARAELERRRQELGDEGTARSYQDLAALRRELAEIRQQLYQKFQRRRDRLFARETALRRAALRIQERKRQLDARAEEAERLRQEWPLRQAELDARTEQVERERKLLEDQARTAAARQLEAQREVAGKQRDVESRERKLAADRAALQTSERQHQADLVRLDRLEALLDRRQKQLQARALEIDRRSEQLQRDSRDLEEQAAQLDEWHTRLTADAERLLKQKQDQETAAAQTAGRAAALEGQQATLAALRTRLERARDEFQRREQALAEQRLVQDATEARLRQRVEEVEKLRQDLEADRRWLAEVLPRCQERQAALDAAVARLRQAQDALAADQEQVRSQREQLDAAAARQEEQAGLLLARGSQMEELQQRVAADRQSLREREATLVKSEQALAALQEQVRRRVEELNERQRLQGEEDRRLQDEAARLKDLGESLSLEHKQSLERLEAQRQEFVAREADVARLRHELVEREAALTTASLELTEARQGLTQQQQALAAERVAWEVERQTAADDLGRTRSGLETAAREAQDLLRSLPDLETRAAAALERLARGREQLRNHLAEVHAFTRQGRDDLEAARDALQAEAERVRRHELALHAARDEHRLAVAAFRQQLIEWQAKVTEMKQALLQDETRLDRRQVEVEEQARQVAGTSADLARQAEALQRQERLVGEKRDEMQRHLADMREWYRRKLRELSGVDDLPEGEPDAAGPAALVPLPVPAPASAADDEIRPAAESAGGILALPGEDDAGDRQLGDLLRSLELVEADTLAALLLEARRQRRSLRQLLLAGNYLTLYQMALIEAGNLPGLVLGPVRVIDRLPATPREAVFRVFDPRGNREAVLRWLAEAEMQDAVRPDEFRQRFAAAAALRHPNLAAVFELLEIGGRPAVLQEWLPGLPSSEWPATAAAPGVWHRLLSQAAQALDAAHAAGLVHGHLHGSSFVMTAEGVLKLCGVGEPRWLVPGTTEGDGEASAADDLAALGRLAADWAAPGAPRKGGKSKALPDELQAILRRLTSPDLTERPASAAALVELLEQVRPAVPANQAAWERFVRQARDQSGDAPLRESA